MDLSGSSLPTPLQRLVSQAITEAGITLFLKRDDLIHPLVSGNKYRKLRYNLIEAKKKAAGLLTFGGAYSNHLFAVAAAGDALNFKTIGIVRGEELANMENPTLRFCREKNMELHFVSRQEYKLRHSPEYLAELQARFPGFYFIPEGGTSMQALEGVREMVWETETQLGGQPDFYCVPVGTGGTAAGIISSGRNVLGFSALKGGEFIKNDIADLTKSFPDAGRLTLFTDYHFGGYARYNTDLLRFMDDFHFEFDVQLEQVYTAKMCYGLFDLIKKGFFQKGTTIVAVHTGGLQGLLRK